MMMYDGMMGGYGLIFMLVYLGLLVYFFYLLSSMAKSLGRIADRLDRLPSLGGERKNQE
ncbi:hypothetical protein [Sporomusa acidovorans]|uniref:CcmD family protein n=1 Tax=Sporomusa acidovorans (strain ATCC 49682 / DSM 3132 / Mol) TaxID=1123286 RepID=A0ABZ3IYZ0_SPOA4|nr:hypothetical protein [Sporomusa acidovorans]OZC17711.1 hypothetical protein SPACI_37150 [Sporomusa acidovorans DSM 3132]SDE12785.1 hypothetical protein SAMN04488499_100894 [Sporomusa acidovorans]